jgi:negative regulator of sigma E activity
MKAAAMSDNEAFRRQADVRSLDAAKHQLAAPAPKWQTLAAWITKGAVAVAAAAAVAGLWSGLHRANEQIEALLQSNRALRGQVGTLEAQVRDLGGEPNIDARPPHGR